MTHFDQPGDFRIALFDDRSLREYDYSVNTMLSGPNSGDRPDRHRGLEGFDRIKTPAERATMLPPEEAEVRGGKA